jgi:chromosome segregation ATPase
VFQIENEIREVSVKLKAKQKEIKQVKEKKDKYSIEKSDLQGRISKLTNEKLILEKKILMLNNDLIEIERGVDERKKVLIQYEIEFDGKTESQMSGMNENVVLNNILKSIQENELSSKKLNIENEQIINQEKLANQKIEYIVNMIRRYEEGMSSITINKKDVENEMLHINQQLRSYESLLYEKVSIHKDKKGNAISISSAELEVMIKNKFLKKPFNRVDRNRLNKLNYKKKYHNTISLYFIIFITILYSN